MTNALRFKLEIEKKKLEKKIEQLDNDELSEQSKDEDQSEGNTLDFEDAIDVNSIKGQAFYVVMAQKYFEDGH